MDLTEFLLARIADDEKRANLAVATDWYEQHNVQSRITKQYGELVGEFIARHDPARVLAECDAKRRIVAEHPNMNADWDDFASCSTCEDRERHDAARWPCKTLRLLALPYADHPDYDPAWRPTD